ncbi:MULTISPECIES: MarR family winged helix-turn-helix transcriptional regulator [Paraburkholderia]|mgnify:CR=1 FL=1|jgi:DNA-binding MarR family transcriptional regulator|uniref:DNA-binding MarR family transcriptional regulator n=1 Tax=Paraburkholderia caledonica TaxID=134536 RepID=A0AB73IGY9_9BURK|nr:MULTISPECIES: MarR family winged helix-turn-helix transcriptional regulator [Paraburkholderia]MDP9649119.1 DNA-binding MarR family transcriptional regulator [Paraburkholderia caledonica]MDR6377957.1 DNA-binding MarR family transcriptional regulator [Paraburkholderia caledonica]MDR7005460.1 DNA-binding MarR family transcriptional regulator [Paraburkholderia strydomiana]
MEEPFDDDCFAIRQAARYVSQIYDRHLASVGLTITQFSLLGRLKRTGPMTMKQLAEAMRMQRTTLVRTIQPLRRSGLLLSEAHGPDARALSVTLTPEGEARLEAGRKHWHAAQAEFEHSFGGQRAQALRGELFAITGHL